VHTRTEYLRLLWCTRDRQNQRRTLLDKYNRSGPPAWPGPGRADKAADGTQALLALETTRTMLLRVAADLHSSTLLVLHLETASRITDLVPSAQKCLTEAHKPRVRRRRGSTLEER
jgi:hypothetical protein